MRHKMSAVIDLVEVRKSFTMHLQGGLHLPVVAGVSFSARAGECVALAGPSGVGKSSILKMIFGNYRCDGGHILLRDRHGISDVATAPPRAIIALRRHAMGYVSQILRAVPRVATLDVVAEPLVLAGVPREEARARAGECCAASTFRNGCGRCRRRPSPAESSSASILRGIPGGHAAAVARRAHRFARRRQPCRRHHAHRREEKPWRRHRGDRS
jgi:predicted ABC-type transport system involved in lysophospholipase L1 biosynthesis ATPase subunit